MGVGNKYGDLHRMLYKLAISTGTKIAYNAPVTTVSVDEDGETARALLANGEILEADIIIGADGYRSIVRDVVTDRDDDGTPSGMSVLTCVARCFLRGYFVTMDSTVPRSLSRP